MKTEINNTNNCMYKSVLALANKDLKKFEDLWKAVKKILPEGIKWDDSAALPHIAKAAGLTLADTITGRTDGKETITTSLLNIVDTKGHYLLVYYFSYELDGKVKDLKKLNDKEVFEIINKSNDIIGHMVVAEAVSKKVIKLYDYQLKNPYDAKDPSKCYYQLYSFKKS